MKGIVAFYPFGSISEPFLVEIPDTVDGSKIAKIVRRDSNPDSMIADVCSAVVRAHAVWARRKPGSMKTQARRDLDTWADCLRIITASRHTLFIHGTEEPMAFMTWVELNPQTQGEFLASLDEGRENLDRCFAQKYGGWKQ